MQDVDRIVFYDKPLVKFERLLETYLAYAPKRFRSFVTAMPVWLKEKLYLKNHLLDLKEDGTFRLNMDYFNYTVGLTMTNPKFHDLFGGPPRQEEGKLTQREMDLASSIQKVTEEVILRLARTV